MHDATDIRAQLERERHIIEGATGNLTRKSSGDLHTVVSGNGMIRAKVGYGLEGGGAYVDAERLAHSWNALPVRNAQVEAVLQVLDDYEVPSKRDDVTGDVCAGMERLEAMIRRAIEEAGK